MKKNIFLTITILFLVFGVFGITKIAKAGCCAEIPKSIGAALGGLSSSSFQVVCQESTGNSCPDGGMQLIEKNLSCQQIKELSKEISFSGFKLGCSDIKSAPATSAPITKVTAVAPAKYEYSLLEGIPGFAEAGTSVDFPVYIMYLYNFGIWTIGICAMFMIALGGYMYLTSAGNTSGTGKAKGIITDAIVGLVLALASYLILYTINPDLVKFNSLTNQPTINSNSQCPLP